MRSSTHLESFVASASFRFSAVQRRWTVNSAGCAYCALNRVNVDCDRIAGRKRLLQRFVKQFIQVREGGCNSFRRTLRGDPDIRPFYSHHILASPIGTSQLYKMIWERVWVRCISDKVIRRFERLLTPDETQQLLIRIFHRHGPRWWRAGRRPWRYK